MTQREQVKFFMCSKCRARLKGYGFICIDIVEYVCCAYLNGETCNYMIGRTPSYLKTMVGFLEDKGYIVSREVGDAIYMTPNIEDGESRFCWCELQR